MTPMPSLRVAMRMLSMQIRRLRAGGKERGEPPIVGPLQLTEIRCDPYFLLHLLRETSEPADVLYDVIHDDPDVSATTLWNLAAERPDESPGTMLIPMSNVRVITVRLRLPRPEGAKWPWPGRFELSVEEVPMPPRRPRRGNQTDLEAGADALAGIGVRRARVGPVRRAPDFR